MSLIEKLEADVRYHTAHVEGHTAILKGATGAREKEVAEDALEMAKNDKSAAEQLLADAVKADADLDLSSPVTGLVRVSAVADLLASSVLSKCDAGLQKFEARIYEKAEHWNFDTTIDAKDEADARRILNKEYPKSAYTIQDIRAA